MNLRNLGKASLAVAFASILFLAMASASFAQGQAPTDSGKKAKVDKAAKKLGKTADLAANQLGRNVVFCILAAHTDVGDAQALKDKFDALDPALPFGQFVAAVILADRTDLPLDQILADLQSGKSLGQIAKDAKESMGEVKSSFGQFRSELARSMTHPPTAECTLT